MLKTAIITGACSGMGLALTHDLLSKQSATGHTWRVILADINASAYSTIAHTLDASRHLFLQTDVTKWADQVEVFKRAFEWSGRIDFFANNAGIDDKERLLDDGDLVEPNLSCIAVDLLAVFSGLKLFIRYARKTKAENFQPKMVITASMAGQYPFFIMPQYTAAKHGCVGLVRAAAPALLRHEGIALNCIMPGFVDTGIILPQIVECWPKENITPMATILRAFNELIEEDGKVEADGSSDGINGVVKSGCAVECSVHRLYYRERVAFADEKMEWVAAQSKEEGILGMALKAMYAKHKEEAESSCAASKV
jgi:15-hydroxyprostaglandin dehydrogenase (NAD)